MGWGSFLQGEAENGAVSDPPPAQERQETPRYPYSVSHLQAHLSLKDNKGPSLFLKHPTAAPSHPAAPGAQDAPPGSQAETVSGALTRAFLSHQRPPESVSHSLRDLFSLKFWNFPGNRRLSQVPLSRLVSGWCSPLPHPAVLSPLRVVT